VVIDEPRLVLAHGVLSWTRPGMISDRVAPLLVTELKPADQRVLGLVSSDPTLLGAGWASMRPKRGAERDVRSQLGVLAKVQRGVEPLRRRLIRDEGIEEVARVVRHT